MTHNFKLKVKLKFIDKSERYRAFSKKYELVGYGNSEKEALKMLNLSIKQSLITTKQT